MATTTKVIVQVHERVTEVQIDADLQSRELGFISGAKVLRVSEDDGTKHNIWAQDSSGVTYDNGVTLSSTLAMVGIATFTAQPILSSTTASQALFTDGSKGVVSNALTGTGNVVMSASPTLTGTITAVTLHLTGSLDIDTDLNVDGDAVIDGSVGIGVLIPVYKTDILGSPVTVGASRSELFISEDNTASTGRGGGIAFGRSTVVYGGIGVRTKASSDTNTKMHFSTRLSNVVTEQATLDNNGDFTVINGETHLLGGNVGIKTAIPVYSLDVLGGTQIVGASRAELFISEDNTVAGGRGGGIAFGRSTVVYGGIGVRSVTSSDTNTKMHFSTRDGGVVTEGMTLDSGDLNVLGSLDVDVDLNVDGDAVVDGDITISVDNKKLLLGASGYGQLYQTANATILYNTAFGGSDGDLELSCGLNGKVILSADLGDMMTLDTSELIVVDSGTEVHITSGILALKENTTPSAVVGWGRVYNKTDNTLYFQDGAGTEKKVITSASGNVIIDGDLTVDTDTLFVVASSNRVGVNNASPASALDVTGQVIVSSTVTCAGLISTGNVSSTSALYAGDNVPLLLGTGNDARVYYDSADLIINPDYNTTGSGIVKLKKGLELEASTTTRATFNVPHGTAPTSPVNGDMWTTTAGLYIRINGSTVGPLS